MMLPVRKTFFNPANFNLAAAGVLGTTQRTSIDRTWPIEEIVLIVDFATNATAANLVGLDNLLGIIKHVNLSVNDGVQPRSVVDYSGIGLLERASLLGFNIDRATSNVIGLSSQMLASNTTVAVPASTNYRLAYRIPLVHPQIEEPLRSRCLLPVHLWPQDPVLTVDFESQANMTSGANFSSVNVTVGLIRRVMPQALNDVIIKTGGYLPFDILEQQFSTFGGAEVRVPVSTPGAYTDLVVRQYKGGANTSRDVIDSVTTLGSESRWRLESGGVVYSEWRWKQLQILNDWSRPLADVPQILAGGVVGTGFIAAASAGAVTTAISNAASGITLPTFNAGGVINPAIGSMVASGTRYPAAASVALDFLGNGIGGDPVDELGSVLDCNLPSRAGLKMELIGTPAAVVTNSSILYFGGHRFFGDLTAWQQVK